MTKRVILFLLLFLICLPFQAMAADNMIQNGSFETENDGLPALWAQDSYVQDTAASSFQLLNGEAHSGSHYAEIKSFQANDAKWIQTIKVKPETTYRITGWIRTEGIGPDQTGANLSIIGIFASSQDVKETLGQWQQVELVGYTGKDQTEIQVAARLGGYGSLNIGTADFDDIAMEELEKAPAGVNAVPFFQQNQGASSSSGHSAYSVLMILYGLGYLIFLALIYFFMIKNRPASAGKAPKKALVFGLLLAAFVVRILLAPTIQGHPIDYTDFVAWANHAYTAGLAHFYTEGMFADYPPGYIYILYVIGFLQHAFSIAYQSAGMTILIKLPAIAADIATSWLLYAFAKKHIGAWAGLAISLLYAFNPGILINSTLWGQIDSIFTLVVVLMAIALYRERVPAASLYFALALLIKPQAVLFAPLLLFALWKQGKWAVAAKSAANGLLLFIVGVLPFVVLKPPFWIIEHYRSMFSSYPYASLNAFNLYALLGANAAPQGQAFLLLSYNAWGYIFTVGAVAFAAWLFYKNKAPGGYFYLAFLLMMLIFNLKTGMHERYDFVALALVAAGFILQRDKRLIYLFTAVTFTHFVNVAYVLRESLDQDYFLPAQDGWMKFISLCNLAILVYACKVGVDLFVKKRLLAVEAGQSQAGPSLFTPLARIAKPKQEAELLLRESQSQPAGWKRKDLILVVALTLVYSVIALYHLGSLKDPQTFWKPQNYGESFYVDLGKTQQVSEMKWFAGLAEGEYKVEQSNNGENWTQAATLELTYQTVFTWQESPLNIEARYIRLTAEKADGALHEIGFFGADSMRPYPVQKLVPLTISDSSQGDIAHLFDEQDTIPEHPSFMNSTYFDEIYHARTAYENLHLLQPYESTHPPLGKLFISIGIYLFGLNAFGWRVIGTLFGIAMVPIMYAFGKRLFRRTDFAFVTAFLFTFDFMHFSQTRIATIDVYGTFFIILMYYSMYRFFTMNFYRDGLIKTWIPLACSGLFFGLGAASKWTGVYAGLGLAFLFFATLFMRMRDYYKAKHLLTREKQLSSDQNAQLRRIVSVFPSYSVKTILCCGVFFLIVPAVIYIASYIPFMMVPGPGHELTDVIKAQKDMYEYHEHLVATHPFSSQWWQWPTIYKPIWYYAGKYMSPGLTSNIVSMGNPAVWWVGLFTLFAMLWIGWRKRDKLALFIAVGFASQYLPWVGVPRLTFIYHYFASIPFVVLSIVYVLKTLYDHAVNPSAVRKATYSYLFVVFLLFAMFYPILSGMVVGKGYVETFLRWFPQWYFYS